MTEKKVTIEMREESNPSGNLQPMPNITRPRAHSALAHQFQYLKLKVENDAEFDRLKRSFEESMGNDQHSYLTHRSLLNRISKNQKSALMRQKEDVAFEIEDMDEHAVPLEDLCLRLGTTIDTGLTNQQAERRRHEEGQNKLPEKEKTAAWVRFSLEMTNWFALLQWTAAFLCIPIYIVSPDGNEPLIAMAFVVMSIILLTGSITYMQGAKSDTIMGGLKKMVPEVCRVRREGKVVQISAEKIVRGDIVEIGPGDRIPADIRIVKADQLKIDSSALTGEEESLEKSADLTHPNNPFLAKNLVFYGTLCLQGRGEGIVIQTGAKTMVGRVAALAAEGDQQKFTLRVELDRLVLILSIFSASLSLLLFLLALFAVDYSLKESVIMLIGLLLASVPEGLLGCTTISLALGANRLAEKGVLVKNLESVEALGSTSCFCLDQTGIVTDHRLTVQHLWLDGWVFEAGSKKAEGVSIKREYDAGGSTFQMMKRAAVLTSQAPFEVQPSLSSNSSLRNPGIQPRGDSWESALLTFYRSFSSIQQIEESYPLAKCKDGSRSKIHFSPSYKYSLSVVREEGDDHHWVVYIKGAPEVVWFICSQILKQGEPHRIDPIARKDFLVANNRFAKNGERVMGFAMLPLNKKIYHPDYVFQNFCQETLGFSLKGFIFIGLISLTSPQQAGIQQSIEKCKNAGIKVIMISGGQTATAAAIAKQAGLLTEETNQDLMERGCSEEKAIEKCNSVVIHGTMITKAFELEVEEGESQLEEWCRKKEVVFARTTSAQKLLIVQAAQRIGLTVAVVGDRVEHSPAIKQGDIGISMNLTGADVTKSAADMILLDDDFSSLVEGVEEGRRIFDNLKKTVVYLLTSNMSQIWPFVAMVVLQIPLPLSAPLLLTISVGTDIYPAIALSLSEPEWDIMTVAPREPDDHLLSGKLLGHVYGYMGELAACGGLFTYNIVMSCYGIPFSIYLQLLSKQAYLPLTNGTIDYYWNSQPIYDEGFNQGHYSPEGTNLNAPSYFTEACFAAVNAGNLKVHHNFPYWLSTLNNQVDLRVTYVTCCGAANANFCPQFSWPDQAQVLQGVSPYSGVAVMFTTEALYYAQSGYFATVVMIQWVTLFCCTSRKMSVIYWKRNNQMLGALFFGACVLVLVLYVPNVNVVFGGRPLPFFLMGIPGLGFAMLLLGWQQLRKGVIRWQEKGRWFSDFLLW